MVHVGRGLAVAVVVAGVVLGLTRSASAQTSTSAALATELTSLMSAQKLDSVAARGGPTAGAEDQFVAALFFPGQLLVVSARYEVPMYVEQKIGNRQYRDVYIDLNAASIAGSKVLVTDAGGNGLAARRELDRPFDIWDNGTKLIRFDGDWGAQQMSEEEYMKSFAALDGEYSRMLQSLVDELK